MKTLFTTIAIGLMMMSAKANHFSAFNLKMFDNGNFSVVLDNQPSCQANTFSGQKIEPGCHKLKVIRYFQNPYSYYPMKKVVYNAWITIPAQSAMYAQINCYRQLSIVKVEPYCYATACGYGDDYDEDESEYGYDNYGNAGNGWNTNFVNQGNGWGNPVVVPPVPMCMSQMEFMQLKNSMASKSFESSKLQIAKQALSYNNFTSAQIADLMSDFSFETTRLDFAKCAYGKVIDKQNFYLTNNAFSFESSIQELNQYIAGK